jgi:gliding motility-associated lipoprotein GldD
MTIKMVLFFIALMLIFVSCNRNQTPRPYGYFRIEMPEPIYETYNQTAVPYFFDKSAIATIIPCPEAGENYWIDISYPLFNANIYCSYKKVEGNLFELTEDARRYVYKHSVMADGIGEQVFQNDEKQVYGVLYDIRGNTASSIQFVLTDSVHHFFRGALYFDNVPNKDSIAPVIDYLRGDMVRLMESFDWK